MSDIEDDVYECPERIWIEQDDCPYFYEESELEEVGSPVTEYIRADLCDELEADNKRLRKALEVMLVPYEGSDCRRDHHGYCQEHFLEEDCCVAEARAALGGKQHDK